VETLLLVPGLACDEDLWAEQAGALADTVDVRVADVTGGDSVAGLARAVLAAAPERFALAGLSLGGYVVLEVLRQAPERVTRVALLDTSARPDAPEQTARRRALLALGEERGMPAALDVLWPAVVAPVRHGDPALRRRFDEMSLRVGWEVFWRQQEAIIARGDRRPDLAAIRVPALVLCGRDDVITPLETSEELAAGIPGAELVVLDGCGHLSTWERPDEVTAALRAWLERRAGG